MISFIGVLAAMVSMALATCSLALAVVVYRRIRVSSASRQERQETAQTAPAAGTPAAAVAAGGGAVDGAPGRLLITSCWFSRLVAPLDVWSARLVVSCLRAVEERLLSSRVPVGCRPRWCQGSLLVMSRLVRLWPLVVVRSGQCLMPCQVEGRGPPVYDVRFLSLIAAATTPYKPEKPGASFGNLC
jgi:hypothetical protein|nr:MAG TPA: hypothetical protein [Caudoviricetes sp.]